MKKSDLLKLPYREYKDEDKTYDSFYIFPTRLKHESGYARIAVVGVIADEPVHICAMPDDLVLPANEGGYNLRMDSQYGSGVLHLWSSRSYKFKTTSLSTSEISLEKST